MIYNQIFYTRHSIQRMVERSLDKLIIEQAILSGKVIAEYPDDKPYPSCLSLYIANNIVLHVVYSIDENKNIFVITVYEPSTEEWNEDFRTRRNKL